MKIEIEMGTAPAGAQALIDLEELLATRLLVQGNSGSGKSHLLRRLLEQSAPWVQQCIVDPEGDFVTLADRFGHLVVDANRPLEELEVIAARVRQHRVSTVLNLEGLEIEGQMRAAAAFLNALFDADRDHWYPMLVVVDEAQMFAPVSAGEFSDDARRASLGAMTNLMCRGRKRGLAGVIATQRLAKLAKNVAAEASNFLMGRTFLDIDMARASDLLGMERRQAEMFRDLKRGHFIALGPALSRRPVPYVIGNVETSARSSSPKLVPLPETPADARDLILKDAAVEAARPVRRPPRPAPPPPAEGILEQLARAADQRAAQAVSEAETAAEAEPVDEAEREAALDAVMADLMADPEAGFRTDAELYQDFLVRCRIRRVAGALPAMGAFRNRLAVARAGAGAETTATTEWASAIALSQSIPEDLQGVFLLVARAAIERAPCPSDATLARAYGSHSPRRARRFLAYFEEHGLVVLRSDLKGRRIVAFPDLETETAAGDPDGPDSLAAAAE
ncbi:ATP-binding protein [Zhengella mangrovi]|uniref:ATP-binding protein n=1 Tax=Zhengella mangrovi TaxID=1982044 RepID=A0A2G1QMA3_9HYPH|nr:ATP-binding protein [Zhengella mangrovi]PHP66599.1 ATP-binding protein [Zhengella mangrovi]